MKKSTLFGFFVLLAMSFLPRLSAQDVFLSNSRSFRFEPLRTSNYFIKGNEMQLNLYGPDKAHSGKFLVPTDMMYRYVYTDSNSVIGKMEPIVMTRPQDFAYVSDICLQAQADCRANYKMWKGSMCGTLFLSIVSPVASLAVAIPASLTPPKIENLGLSEVDMLQEGIYFHTYRREAKKIKSKRTWMAYGIGLGIHVGAIFGILAAVGH